MAIQKCLNSVINTLNNTDTVESAVVVEIIQKHGISKISQDPSELVDIIEFLANNLLTNRHREIIAKNEQIADAIDWFVTEGVWVNLSQLRCVLLSDIESALKVNKDRQGERQATEQMLENVELERKWLNLSRDEKLKIMQIHDSLNVITELEKEKD